MCLSFSWHLALPHEGSWMRNAMMERARCWRSFSNLAHVAVILSMLRKQTRFRDTSSCLGLVPSSRPHTRDPGLPCTDLLSASSCCLFFSPCQTLLQLVSIFPSSMAAKAFHRACSTFSCQAELPASRSIDSNKASRRDSQSWRTCSTASWREQCGERCSCFDKKVPHRLQRFEHWVPCWWHSLQGGE